MMITREEYTEEIQDEMIDAFDNDDVVVEVNEQDPDEEVEHGS